MRRNHTLAVVLLCGTVACVTGCDGGDNDATPAPTGTVPLGDTVETATPAAPTAEPITTATEAAPATATEPAAATSTPTTAPPATATLPDTEACDGLGERIFSVARPPSLFGAAVLAGADVSVGSWGAGPLRLCAGPDAGDGVHALTLLEDVVVSMQLLDNSVACIKLFAAGSGGSIDCDGGTAYGVQWRQDSNGSAAEDPPVVETGLGDNAGPGAATLTGTVSLVNLPAGSDQSECQTAGFGALVPVALTTGTAATIVTNALDLIGDTVVPETSHTAKGSNFDCADWTETDSVGTLVAPLAALDTLIGDVAAAWTVVDRPVDTDGGGDERFFMTDDLGGAMVFHGVNVTDDRRTHPEQFSTDAEDYQRIASWGFNLIRLSLFWESLEPTRGVYEQEYIDRAGKILDWAAAAGLHVVLDFHQDQYGGRFGRGMPEWTVRDDGLPFEDQHSYMNYFQPAVMAAFDHFYGDQDLQDAYAAAWMQMVTRFKDHPALLGYDLMNEPFVGTAEVEEFESTILTNMYERLVATIRAVDEENWIIYEPFAFTTVAGQPSHLDIIEGERLAYFPHMYHPTIEFGSPYVPDDYLDRYSSVRIPEAARQGAPLMIGEWGADMTVENSAQYVLDAVAAMDRFTSGWMWWVYHRDTKWGLLDRDGNERPTVDLLIRPYPRRIAGEPVAYSYDPETRVCEFSFAEKEGVSGTTDIFIPAERVYPDGWIAEVSDPEAPRLSVWDPEREILSITTDPARPEHTIRVLPAGQP